MPESKFTLYVLCKLNDDDDDDDDEIEVGLIAFCVLEFRSRPNSILCLRVSPIIRSAYTKRT